jgi:two-component system, cell cycle sensor histidine kinase and response regulator CckA
MAATSNNREDHDSLQEPHDPSNADSGLVATATRVLLVDDESSVREVERRILQTGGFEVYPVGTFAAAMTALQDSTLHFDVLLTDVVLSPGLGTDLLHPARQRRPNLRLCVMSGLLPSPEVESTVRAMGATFISKPFERAELLSAVKERARPPSEGY